MNSSPVLYYSTQDSFYWPEIVDSYCFHPLYMCALKKCFRTCSVCVKGALINSRDRCDRLSQITRRLIHTLRMPMGLNGNPASRTAFCICYDIIYFVSLSLCVLHDMAEMQTYSWKAGILSLLQIWPKQYATLQIFSFWFQNNRYIYATKYCCMDSPLRSLTAEKGKSLHAHHFSAGAYNGKLIWQIMFSCLPVIEDGQ